MRSFMLGAGFACGLLLTGLCIARWAFSQHYIPMKERDCCDGCLDYDCTWGDWPTIDILMN